MPAQDRKATARRLAKGIWQYEDYVGPNGPLTGAVVANPYLDPRLPEKPQRTKKPPRRATETFVNALVHDVISLLTQAGAIQDAKELLLRQQPHCKVVRIALSLAELETLLEDAFRSGDNYAEAAQYVAGPAGHWVVVHTVDWPDESLF